MHFGDFEYHVPIAKPRDSSLLYGGCRRTSLGGNDGKLIGDEIPEAQRNKRQQPDTGQDGASRSKREIACGAHGNESGPRLHHS